MFQTYKLMISLLWMISSLLNIFIARHMYFEKKVNHTFNGEDATLLVTGIFVLMATICVLVAVGTYFQKRKTLFIVIPCLIFSIVYFIDNVQGEYIFIKYVFQSLFMTILNLTTIHIILRQHISQIENT